mmetsp:Transcript_32936/g.102070  ORF Transcript_32936/g.102070 Transcript_32936/m.102070 type:complete len:361 (-) Transcript_32936:67-1149(-)
MRPACAFIALALPSCVALGAPGPLLRPSGVAGRFDSAAVVNPVVLPPDSDGEEWRMFYYGTTGQWADPDCKPFLPTGACGLALSPDGVAWTRVDGALEGGAIFAPSPNPDAWDGLHVGVGDVIRVDGELVMFYLGGSREAAGPLPAGIKMQIGRATSADGGRTWERDSEEPVLRLDEAEGLFASWPRIMRPPSGPWRMLYHSFDGQAWRVFGATSDDAGRTWSRATPNEPLLKPGPAGAFDARGIGTRAVAAGGGGWLMVYEGVDDKDGTHRLGAARSKDGATWTKDVGPVLEPGGAAGEWTTQVVGTPYLLPMADGTLRLYHCGKPIGAGGAGGGHCIGCLESDGDVTRDAWRPVLPPA